MKKLYFLDEEERQRILNIHESATKRQYLSEQTDRQSNINRTYCSVKGDIINAKDSKLKGTKWSDFVTTYKVTQAEIDVAKKSCVRTPEERQTNITKVYCGLKNGIITAGEYKDKKWDVYVEEWKVLPNEVETAKKSCPKTNNLQQNRQQIITKTSNTTKAIQQLLGLEQTGNMDSALLQKINDKLNGKPQEAPKSDVNTQTPPKAEPLQTSLKPAGVTQQQLTTPSPEQLTAGLQQMQQKAAATAAGLKR